MTSERRIGESIMHCRSAFRLRTTVRMLISTSTAIEGTFMARAQAPETRKVSASR
jgi:hypothetical protein